jgi:quercetin dioxygenase-like cupin family protein
MFDVMLQSEDLDWKSGPYEGVELLTLRKDEKTGGVTVLRKFKAGVTVPAHVHPEANESVYILSGEWDESGQVFGAGTYFHVAKGKPHGPHKAVSEVVSLTVFDGPLTVENV